MSNREPWPRWKLILLGALLGLGGFALIAFLSVLLLGEPWWAR